MAKKTTKAKDPFADAQERVKALKTRPDNQTLLDLYSLYKQATEGDVSGDRPGLFDVKGRAKYDAWAKRKGLKKADAEKQYVALVGRLAEED